MIRIKNFYKWSFGYFEVLNGKGFFENLYMPKILVVDEDLDIHEIIHDILEINFKTVQIDRALNSESFLSKIQNSQPIYDIIIYNLNFDDEINRNSFQDALKFYPDLLKRVILLDTAAKTRDIFPELALVQTIHKPFNLDNFAEIIRKACP